MADGVWRNFRFFDNEPLAADSALAEISVVCTCLTPTSLVVGDCEGQVFFLDRHSASTTASPGGTWFFQAYAGPVTHIRYCALRNTLITIGNDDAISNTILRVWDLDHLAALYRGLVDPRPTTVTTPVPGAAATDASLRWRPPCQEHRLLPTGKGVSGGAASALSSGEEAPLVTILLDESKQLRHHFKLSSAAVSTSASSPSDSLTAAGASSRAGGDGSGRGGGTLSCGSIRSAVVSFDVALDLSCAAVGLVTCDCVVLKGDLAKGRSVRVLTIRSGLAKGPLTFVGLPGTQFVTLLENQSAGDENYAAGVGGIRAFSFLTGGVRTPTSSAGVVKVDESAVEATVGEVQVLYTVYQDVVTCWALRANGNWSEYPCPTPSGGAPRFGAALTPQGELLVLWRQPATHTATGSRIVRIGPATPASGAPVLYDPRAKSSVHTIDVDHVPGRCFLYTYRQYLALLVQHDGKPELFQLQCFDLTYHIRGLIRPQEMYTNCATLLADGTDILVLFLDPTVRSEHLRLRGVRLREVDTHKKLELLFSKECYGIAQQLAHTMEGADPTLQLRIRKRYGDYLYAKGKFDDAMTQYMDTIGHLESSYVIRRYMGSAHMSQLIRYLEELHNQRHSTHTNVAHTTLLLMCYIKNRDEKRLNAFIHRQDVRFEPKNAIEVCRTGGYAEAALYIADRYAAVYDCAYIRLYDMHDPLETLSYVRTLGIDEAESICAQLGRELLHAAPRATTELLMELCVHWRGPGRRLVDASALPAVIPAAAPFSAGVGCAIGDGPRHPHRANASAFLHIFVDAPVCLMHFLRAVVESGVLDEDNVGPVPIPAAVESKAATPSSSPAPTSQTTVSSTHAVLYNTLLELYMTSDLKNDLRLVPQTVAAYDSVGDTPPRITTRAGGLASSTSTAEFPSEPYKRRLEQALTFLEAYKGLYDPYLALSHAHQHNFQDGILYLLRFLGLPGEIQVYYSAKLDDSNATPAERHEATMKLFQACKESSPSKSSTSAMWMTLLSQLVRSTKTEWLDIVNVLDYIEAHDALPPVVVLEILRNSPQCTLDLRTVRSYCQRCLLKQARQVQEVSMQTSKRLSEIERIKREVVALQSSAVIFQSTACAHCHQTLETPTVYFMCKHAFHHRCLYTPTECNICGVAHRRQIAAIREASQRDMQWQNPRSFTAQFFQDVEGGQCAQEKGAGANVDSNLSPPQDGFCALTDYVARGVLGTSPPYKDVDPFSYQPPAPPLTAEGLQRGAVKAAATVVFDIW
ncbi:hypothetical protein JKF63_03996 [Porcisia hertigi]|uniref:RING-type domain-containing protein n=1 Tax=Porcisia hertigi TaxID=2761500 RepID=A0A836I6N8_9TRYP|nr:hypothetical protein JKF63_03996 [Porcisia hertigi]